jgi:hypothetical protein
MKRLLFMTLIAAFLLAACGTPAMATQAPSKFEMSRALSLPAEPASGGAADASEFYNDALPQSASVEAAAIERLVIQNADVAIVVSDVTARMKDIQALAEKLGGFVVSSNLYQTQVYTPNQYVDVPQATVTIRVPSEKLDEALEAIKKDVVEVQTESRSGQDVTADYVDLQSRLKNLEATESALTNILENATKTEDVLTVFNQLTAIREQIELVKGQMKYYEESAALSAINITIVAEATIQPIEIGGWKPQGVARDAIQDLIYFLQNFVNWLIRFVLYTLPVLIAVGIPLYLVFLGVRALFRRFRKPKVKPVQTESPK